MFTKIIQLDIKQFNIYLLSPVSKTYKDLIKEIKQYITVSGLLEILGISVSTHNRYLKGDPVLPSILLHIDLILKSYKEM